jgi:hypothetical protein
MSLIAPDFDASVIVGSAEAEVFGRAPTTHMECRREDFGRST